MLTSDRSSNEDASAAWWGFSIFFSRDHLSLLLWQRCHLENRIRVSHLFWGFHCCYLFSLTSTGQLWRRWSRQWESGSVWMGTPSVPDAGNDLLWQCQRHLEGKLQWCLIMPMARLPGRSWRAKGVPPVQGPLEKSYSYIPQYFFKTCHVNDKNS